MTEYTDEEIVEFKRRREEFIEWSKTPEARVAWDALQYWMKHEQNDALVRYLLQEPVEEILKDFPVTD